MARKKGGGARRTRLVRHLRRPDGAADELLRDAHGHVHAGPEEAADRRRLDARRLRHAAQIAARPASSSPTAFPYAPQPEEHHARPRPSRAPTSPRPSQFDRPDDGVAVTSFDRSIRARRGLAAPGACRTCRRSRSFEEHHRRRDHGRARTCPSSTRTARSMFPEGSQPAERAHAGTSSRSSPRPCASCPNRMPITGHTATRPAAARGRWPPGNCRSGRAISGARDPGRRPASRTTASPRSPARPTPSRCSPTTPIWRPIAGWRSRCCKEAPPLPIGQF